MLKKKKKEISYSLDDYNILFKNQVLVHENFSTFLEKLNTNEESIVNEIRNYLKLDDSFVIKPDIANMYAEFTILDTDCELCLYINLIIMYDNVDISKKEQLFLYFFNKTVEVQII